MNVDKKVFDKYLDIVFFLDECQENDYELDSDDIKHIIRGDFEYVRKQYQIIELESY